MEETQPLWGNRLNNAACKVVRKVWEDNERSNTRHYNLYLRDSGNDPMDIAEGTPPSSETVHEGHGGRL